MLALDLLPLIRDTSSAFFEVELPFETDLITIIGDELVQCVPALGCDAAALAVHHVIATVGGAVYGLILHFGALSR